MKSLNVISENYIKFNYLEKELYEKKGIAIQLTNNRKKSMLKSDIIINLDFNEEELKKCKIKKDSIIINVNNKKIKEVVSIIDYKITIKDKLDSEILKNNISDHMLYEGMLYEKYGNNLFIDIQKELEKNVSINYLILNNGKKIS